MPIFPAGFIRKRNDIKIQTGTGVTSFTRTYRIKLYPLNSATLGDQVFQTDRTIYQLKKKEQTP